MKRSEIREYYADGLEGGVAEYKCEHCGEWYTELELTEKALRDEPCLNCGNDDYEFNPTVYSGR